MLPMLRLPMLRLPMLMLPMQFDNPSINGIHLKDIDIDTDDADDLHEPLISLESRRLFVRPLVEKRKLALSMARVLFAT